MVVLDHGLRLETEGNITLLLDDLEREPARREDRQFLANRARTLLMIELEAVPARFMMGVIRVSWPDEDGCVVDGSAWF
jgi:hypothetical protein